MKTFLAILASLIVLAAAAIAQTTTTNCDTSATVNGDHVDGSTRCTSTDDSAERAAQAKRQADQDKAWQDFGSNLGNMIAQIGIKKDIKKYCEQHQGEPWNWQVNGQNLSGTCPGEISQATAQKLIINASAESFKKSGVAGYAEIVGDRLTVHSERASAIRFKMLLHDPANQGRLKMIAQAGIATYVYTNDADVNLTYDVKSGQILTAPTEPAEQTAPSLKKIGNGAIDAEMCTTICPSGMVLTCTGKEALCKYPSKTECTLDKNIAAQYPHTFRYCTPAEQATEASQSPKFNN